MANTMQAAKRHRQNQKRNLRNRMAKSEIKTYTKKLLSAVEQKDGTTAQNLLRLTQAKLDKAAKRGILHHNTVARRKSLLHRRVATISS
ncbi:MAG: 30S ribosomal protein S20 [Planctomycetota bacterium]